MNVYNENIQEIKNDFIMNSKSIFNGDSHVNDNKKKCKKKY